MFVSPLSLSLALLQTNNPSPTFLDSLSISHDSFLFHFLSPCLSFPLYLSFFASLYLCLGLSLFFFLSLFFPIYLVRSLSFSVFLDSFLYLFVSLFVSIPRRCPRHLSLPCCLSYTWTKSHTVAARFFLQKDLLRLSFFQTIYAIACYLWTYINKSILKYYHITVLVHIQISFSYWCLHVCMNACMYVCMHVSMCNCT